MEEFKTIQQALEVANKSGCFTLGDSYKIFIELEQLKKSYSFYKDEYNTKNNNSVTDETI